MKAGDTLSLRDVGLADAEVLFRWANDPVTRKAALNTATIGWDAHCEWLDQKLASPDATLWIAMTDAGQPVGCIRFETADDWESVRLSYTVAPEARRQGIGRRIVEAGVARIRGLHPGARIVAEVRAANVASLRIFRGLSWQETDARDDLFHFMLTATSK